MIARKLTLRVPAWLCAPVVALALWSAPASAATYVPAGSFGSASSCPNELFRTGFSAALPDCRAYELVSPQGGEPKVYEAEESTYQATVAAENGERLAFYANVASPGAPSAGPYFMSTRTPTGWSTEDLVPPQSTTSGFLCFNTPLPAYSPDLTKAILGDGAFQAPKEVGGGSEEDGDSDCGHDEPRLVPGEPLGHENLFVRGEQGASYELIDPNPLEGEPNGALFQTASSDLSHVVFGEAAKLTPNAPAVRGYSAGPAGRDYYEWASGGGVRLVTVLPDGEPAANGALVDARGWGLNGPGGDNSPTFVHALSTDGKRVFFEAEGKLYGRENADEEQSRFGPKGECDEPEKACTVQVDASQASGPGGGGSFMWASADGSKVFFTDGDSAGLTGDTVSGSGRNLYEYDLNTRKLTDLTPDAEVGVIGVSGVSESGEYVYFGTEGVLTGQEENGYGAKAEAGQENLYLYHEGTLRFIANVGTEMYSIWGYRDFGNGANVHHVRVSPNGEFIGFESVRSLTGYPGGYEQIFLYDAAQNRLSCVSCDPSGAPPTESSTLPGAEFTDLGPNDTTSSYLQRNVLDDGRVFFQTYAGLLPNDTNERADVYEYEDGRLHLISNPEGGGAYFYDASASGNDVFIVTGQRLVGSDTQAAAIFDVRVDGGLPEAGSLTGCNEEDCKGAVTAPALFAPPTSATFSGAGNPAPTPAVTPKATPKSKPAKCKRGHVRRRGKCVKKAKAKAKKSAKGRK
ncbi:MAG TPA: hypothetical protein VNY52_01275 [Solirubrobacteraceae bacterium]|jgi:hypothetical protein|nr:hypothetical protein [Solirubrobacteraceae bacterium]